MKNFKPSGVDWIGDIPAHWQIAKVGYFFDIVLGKMLVPDQTSPNQTLENYLCAANIKYGGIDLNVSRQMWFDENEKNLYLLKRGDLLVTEGGSVGVCCFYQDEFAPCYIQNSVHRVRPKEGASEKFLYYWMIHVVNSGYLDFTCNKATILHYTKKKFSKTPFPLPPLDEQEKIAAYLDRVCGALDREIKIQRALIEKLRVYKKSLVSETVTGGLNPNVQKKFSGVDWLGDIPTHWQLIKLKFVARNNIETLSERTAGDTPIKYIDIGSVDYSDGVKKIQEFIFEDAPTRARRVLHEGDTIISTVRTYLKAIAYIEKIFDGHIGSTGFAVLTPREKIFGKFLYYAVSSAPFIGAVEANSFGVSYPAVNDSILKNLKFALPPRDEQEKIAAFLDRKCQRIDENISKRTALVARLTEYKKSLIYETVTGKREV